MPNSSGLMNASLSVAIPRYGGWNAFSVCETLAAAIGILLNGLVILVCLTNKRMHTPFTAYLLAVTVSNFLILCVFTPLDVISSVVTLRQYGRLACHIYLYFAYVFGGVLFNAHVLITVNRVWAITFPLSYRNHHSLPVAGALVAGMVAYVHAVCLPVVVIDALYYRPSLTRYGCVLNVEAQLTWTICLQFIIYIFPVVIIALAYPFLWYKQRQRTTKKQGNSTDASLSEAASLTAKPPPRAPAKRQHTSGFIVLTVVTVIIMVSFAPTQIVFTASLLGVQRGLEIPGMIAAFLQLIQPATDPVLFMLCLGNLRAGVGQLLGWKRA
ncbi:5-hydroxytryptamine receptor 1D-like [Paramacrobiotus metropolitanus]|uniref:5-hydroxytryptamine receptor 1D-like n=1 Tax=Paramacrobiotus metropolitanus TaxID=2943436 RepID=UPI002445643C|nr:5-hydroxytryptamine receptor 1D-like [Paramacrobiotus metropolitanus]